MTEQNTLSISEMQQANNGNVQAKQAIYGEMEKMWTRGQRLDIQTLLQLVKQQACEFSKDDVLEICLSSRFSLVRERGHAFTPNKIAELISVIAAIYNPKTVIDICCGTGNILSYFKSLQVVKGIDINIEIVQLAQYINPNADIVAADTLHYEFSDIKYDLVIGQPPFGLMLDNRRNAEVEIINNGLKLLDVNGVAIFIVSDQLLANNRLTEFRQQLLSNFALDMVISLPAGIFPHTSIKASVLVVRNGKQNQEVFMPVFEDNSIEIVENFKQHKGESYFSEFEITANNYRLDRNLYMSLEAIEEMVKGHHELIKLSDVSEIIKGRVIDKNAFISKGEYFSFNRKDRDGNNFIDNISDERCVLRPDDIVVSLIGPNNKIHFYKDDGIKTVITQNYAIIRPAKDKYISTYLQTEDGQNLFRQQINRHLVGLTMPHLTILSLANIVIPLLPLSELNELVSRTIKLNNETRLFLLTSSECVKNKQYDQARSYIEKAFTNADAEESQHKDIYLENINYLEALEKKEEELEEKSKELNNLVAMFAHNFLGTLQCIRSNAEHENNPTIHLKTVKMMGGALTAFSILSADDDKLVEQLKQDNAGETCLQQSLANNLALAISQLLGKTNKDKIVNLYLHHLRKTQQIENDTTSEELRANRDYRQKWQALQHQWEDEFNALFSEKADLPVLQKWITDNFFPVEITGFDSVNISFKEYGITDSIFLIVFMEIFVNAFKYMDVIKNEALTLKLCEEDLCYKLTCENPNARETGRGTHKGMDFLKTIAKKLGGQFMTEVTGNSFKSTFAIPSELLK
jgi:type I restriction-modification system DNA methylase subunit